MKYRNVLRKLAYVQHPYRQIMHKKAAWYNPVSWFSGEDNSAYDVDALNAEIARIQEANPGMSRADARTRAIQEDDKKIDNQLNYAYWQYVEDMNHAPTDVAYWKDRRMDQEQATQHLQRLAQMGPQGAAEHLYRQGGIYSLRKDRDLERFRKETNQMQKRMDQELRQGMAGSGNVAHAGPPQDDSLVPKEQRQYYEEYRQYMSDEDAAKAARMKYRTRYKNRTESGTPGAQVYDKQYSKYNKDLTQLEAQYADARTKYMAQQQAQAKEPVKQKYRPGQGPEPVRQAPSPTQARQTPSVPAPAQTPVSSKPQQPVQPRPQVQNGPTISAKPPAQSPAAPRQSTPVVQTPSKPSSTPAPTTPTYTEVAQTLPEISELKRQTAQARAEADEMSLGLGRSGQQKPVDPQKQAEPQPPFGPVQAPPVKSAPQVAQTPQSSQPVTTPATNPAAASTTPSVAQTQPSTPPAVNRPARPARRNFRMGRNA